MSLSSWPRRKTLTVVGVACVVAQLACAWIARPRTESPNASTRIASHWVSTGEYAVPGTPTPYRALVLPGEPAYIAAGLITLPPWLLPFLHLPVTLLFVLAVTSAGWWAGGPKIATIAGAVAAFDPFVAVHGLVWDDTFLAAALDWTIIAFVASALGQPTKPRGAVGTIVVLIAAGVAAVTRLQSQVFLAVLAAALLMSRRFQPAKRYGFAIIAGVVVALGLWGFRNQRVLGEFFIGSTHDGQTLWHSNYPEVRTSIFDTGVAQSHAPMLTADTQGELASDRDYRQRALEQMIAHPAETMKTSALKIAVSVLGIDFRSPLRSTRNLAAITFNTALLVAAIAGAIGSRTHHTLPILSVAAAISAIVTFVMLLVGPVGLRYRIGFAGFLYLWGAVAVQQHWPRRTRPVRTA